MVGVIHGAIVGATVDVGDDRPMYTLLK